MNLQAKLLRAIEYGEFHPLGAAKPRRVDARIVAATNADLREQSAAGRFRRDLYFRLRGGAIHLPPLREREGDIPMLFRHFLEKSRRQSDRPTPRPTDSLERALTQWTWPGNVRELKTPAPSARVPCWIFPCSPKDSWNRDPRPPVPIFPKRMKKRPFCARWKRTSGIKAGPPKNSGLPGAPCIARWPNTAFPARENKPAASGEHRPKIPTESRPEGAGRPLSAGVTRRSPPAETP